MLGEVYPTPDDTAIVMYTSGSTGTPKVFLLKKIVRVFGLILTELTLKTVRINFHILLGSDFDTSKSGCNNEMFDVHARTYAGRNVYCLSTACSCLGTFVRKHNAFIWNQGKNCDSVIYFEQWCNIICF